MHEIGPWAINMFLDNPENNRFLQSFRSFAASASFSEITTFGAGESKPDEESLALMWHHPTAFPEMLPNMRKSIEAYTRFKATGQFQLI